MSQSKCTKVKNPCKICLQSVTQKTGLQCRGACHNWVHYRCLNYTPGKVKDIKAGIIKITCPCPDCKTSLPKEYRTDEPYSCTNIRCPANKPPVCENSTCPSNSEPPHSVRPPSTNKPPITVCGDSCKEYASPNANAPDVCEIKRSKSFDSVYNSPSNCSSLQYGGDSMSSPLKTVEQMCNTVGQLTGQINELMLKLKECLKDVNAGSGSKPPCHKSKKPTNDPCVQKGPRAMCPKPCFCPGNPGP